MGVGNVTNYFKELFGYLTDLLYVAHFRSVLL